MSQHTKLYGICENKCLVPIYSKDQVDEKSLKVKQNLSVTPVANTDTATNTAYPYKYEIEFEGVTENYVPDASLNAGVECSEFVGLATATDKVIIYFDSMPANTPISFSYVSVVLGMVIEDV